MSTLLLTLSTLRPYWKSLTLTACCISIYATLSGVSILAVSPFVRILFQSDAAVVATAPEPDEANRSSQAPGWQVLPQELREWVGERRSQVESFLLAGDRVEALGRTQVGALRRRRR